MENQEKTPEQTRDQSSQDSSKTSFQLFIQLLLRVSALEKLLLEKKIITEEELGKYLVENLQNLKNTLEEKLK